MCMRTNKIISFLTRFKNFYDIFQNFVIPFFFCVSSKIIKNVVNGLLRQAFQLHIMVFI